MEVITKKTEIIFKNKSHSAKEIILALTVKVYTAIVPATHVCTVIVILTIISK